MSKYDQAKVLATEALIGMQHDCLAMQKLTKEEQDSLLFSVTALVRDMLAENAKLRAAIAEALAGLDDCTCNEPGKGHEAANCNVAIELRRAFES